MTNQNHSNVFIDDFRRLLADLNLSESQLMAISEDCFSNSNITPDEYARRFRFGYQMGRDSQIPDAKALKGLQRNLRFRMKSLDRQWDKHDARLVEYEAQMANASLSRNEPMPPPFRYPDQLLFGAYASLSESLTGYVLLLEGALGLSFLSELVKEKTDAK